MVCKTCGRSTQNEDANFCEYCGSPFKEHLTPAYTVMPQYNPQVQTYGQMNGPMGGTMGSSMNGMTGGAMGGQMNGSMNDTMNQSGSMGQTNADKPISFLNWLGSYALLLIPYVGWLAFITLLFVWAFSKSTPPSKKNWARVNLIFAAVLIIIVVVYLVIILNSSMFQDMMNGTFNYNDYYNSIFGNLK